MRPGGIRNAGRPLDPPRGCRRGRRLRRHRAAAGRLVSAAVGPGTRPRAPPRPPRPAGTESRDRAERPWSDRAEPPTHPSGRTPARLLARGTEGCGRDPGRWANASPSARLRDGEALEPAGAERLPGKQRSCPGRPVSAPSVRCRRGDRTHLAPVRLDASLRVRVRVSRARTGRIVSGRVVVPVPAPVARFGPGSSAVRSSAGSSAPPDPASVRHHRPVRSAGGAARAARPAAVLAPARAPGRCLPEPVDLFCRARCP